MPVRDAVPRPDNPAPVYPSDSTVGAAPTTVMLRFVVGPEGTPEPGTLELARAAPLAFIKAAFESLNRQRFAPATVNGCPVAQQVDYPFAFLPPEGVPQGLTPR
jgi:hypothetical protein